jgi:hypothetical protein
MYDSFCKKKELSVRGVYRVDRSEVDPLGTRDSSAETPCCDLLVRQSRQ